MKYSYKELAKMIDHSLLHPTMTDQELEEGCRLAVEYQVASVCIKPYATKRAAELLKGTGVLVGAVFIGFPHGNSTTESKRYETELACKDGAVEIDMVTNVGKALSGDWQYVENDIRAVCDEAHRRGAMVKVIFENDYLGKGGAGLSSDAFKKKLCEICERAGADWIKTSTGYGFVKQPDGTYNYKGATEHDLALMRAAVSPKVQVKAAGGVRDLDGLIRRCGSWARRVAARARRLPCWMNTTAGKPQKKRVKRTRPPRAKSVQAAIERHSHQASRSARCCSAKPSRSVISALLRNTSSLPPSSRHSRMPSNNQAADSGTSGNTHAPRHHIPERAYCLP